MHFTVLCQVLVVVCFVGPRGWPGVKWVCRWCHGNRHEESSP